MCKPASFVVTKKQVFWSKKTESHHEIVSEFKLKEQDVRKNYQIICVEIIPQNDDFASPLSKWELTLDGVGLGGYSRELPDWYDQKDVERRCRAELKEWRKSKVVMPGKTRKTLKNEQIIVVYGIVENVWDNGTVENVWDNGIVENVWDNGIVEDVWGNGIVKNVLGNGIVENVWDNGIVVACNSLSPGILKSSRAVLVDRSKPNVKCFIGKDN